MSRESQRRSAQLYHKRRRKAVREGDKTLSVQTLWLKQPHTCGICAEEIERIEDASLDHIVPLIRDGEHSEENCQLAHKLCNQRKGNREGQAA
jgi:5-methylcytosine-specific restriction endonuclease McrA